MFTLALKNTPIMQLGMRAYGDVLGNACLVPKRELRLSWVAMWIDKSMQTKSLPFFWDASRRSTPNAYFDDLTNPFVRMGMHVARDSIQGEVGG